MTVHLHKESEKLFTATLESIFRRLNWENKGIIIMAEMAVV